MTSAARDAGDAGVMGLRMGRPAMGARAEPRAAALQEQRQRQDDASQKSARMQEHVGQQAVGQLVMGDGDGIKRQIGPDRRSRLLPGHVRTNIAILIAISAQITTGRTEERLWSRMGNIGAILGWDGPSVDGPRRRRKPRPARPSPWPNSRLAGPDQVAVWQNSPRMPICGPGPCDPSAQNWRMAHERDHRNRPSVEAI